MHCHPANLLAMTYVHSLDEKAFTRTLWQMCTECIVVFPRRRECAAVDALRHERDR